MCVEPQHAPIAGVTTCAKTRSKVDCPTASFSCEMRNPIPVKMNRENSEYCDQTADNRAVSSNPTHQQHHQMGEQAARKQAGTRVSDGGHNKTMSNCSITSLKVVSASYVYDIAQANTTEMKTATRAVMNSDTIIAMRMRCEKSTSPQSSYMA